MGQFVAAIRGMASACTALNFPVVSGNVSLYNETEGRGILPTPAIGAVGVLADAAQAVGLALRQGQDVVLIGEITGWLGQSLWLREIVGLEAGAPPPVFLAQERAAGDFVRAQILSGHIESCHDVSDGGLLIAIAEMAIAGHAGIALQAPDADVPAHAFWFGEEQGRYVAGTTSAAHLLAAAGAAGVPARLIGRVEGNHLKLPGVAPMSIDMLMTQRDRFFPAWLDGVSPS
jgi:phosphoribosylformylglycinamidine synthase